MNKVVLFGATGHIGKSIAKELVGRGYEVTAVVRNNDKAKTLSHLNLQTIIADPCTSSTLRGLLNGFDIVVSALGKSVSPKDLSKPTFSEVDLDGNNNILNEAGMVKRIKKFVYISAFHSERYQHLEYFRVHHEFSEQLKKSGIDYSIIKPPAVFSAFIDVLEMARKGMLVNLGKGDKKTNPIWEGDLAKIAVDAITQSNTTIDAGGKMVYTRKQLNELVLQAVKPGKKLRTVPAGMVKILLPILKMTNKNMYDKFAFFLEVLEHDTIAPQVGEMTFEDYICRMTKG